MRAAALIAAVLLPAMAPAQELEPRAYTNAPVGMNFLVAGYSRITGPVLLDPSITATDVNARINAYSLGYARYFGLLGRSANVSIGVPYVEADLHGQVMDAGADVHRSGFGDLRLRGAVNLIGHPARTPAEFRRHADEFSAGLSLGVIAPTGEYDASRFINIGTHRWAFKPEVGFSYPIGNWFTEASAGAWFFTDNDNYLGSHRRSQEPLALYQLHVGYDFRPGLWLAVDYGWYIGGRTAVDGVANDDAQRNSRAGLALSLPLSSAWSTKLAWSKGTAVRVGGDFEMFSIALQYRWFD